MSSLHPPPQAHVGTQMTGECPSHEAKGTLEDEDASDR